MQKKKATLFGESSSSVSSECVSESDDSDLTYLSNCSNWTKGRSKQRLKVPNSLKHNNFISKAVIERKIKMRNHFTSKYEE
jgi:hypothetical protein